MNAPVLQDFSYDPFDPAVMADPLPYYRVLRDEHPVYYIEKWDTYALSRFSDIWQVLEIAMAPSWRRKEHCRPQRFWLSATMGRCPIRRCTRCRSTRTSTRRSTTACGAAPRVRSGRNRCPQLADRIRTLANERLDELLPRGAFDLTQEYGGIVAASVVCELLGLPVDLAPDVLATVNAGSLAQPGSGVEVANARPGYLEYLVPIVQRRRADSADGELPIVDNLIDYRLPDGSAFNDIEAATQMLGVFIGGTETVPKIVAHGLWELGRRPDQLAAVRADLDANVPVAREEMIRYCAPAQWFARTVRKPFTIHGTTIEPGQRIITLLASANRDEREYANPDDFVWNRPIERLLAFGRGTALLPWGASRASRDRDHGDRMAQAG